MPFAFRVFVDSIGAAMPVAARIGGSAEDAIKIMTQRDAPKAYVKSVDFLGYSCNVATTQRLSEALKFEDHAAAFAFWNYINPAQPFRPDGKANKPLTAFTVEILPV